MQLTCDLSGLQPATRQSVIRNLQHEDAAKYALGQVEQIKMKRFADATVGPGTTKEHFGPLSMIISQDQAARARLLYGDMCFADPDFVPWLLRKHEDYRVKIAPTKVQSGWTPRSNG